MTQKELNVILEKHKKWLAEEKGGVRANLVGANLCNKNLRDADLRSANLRGAFFYGANLQGADLRDSILYNADFRDANLCYANFHNANLCGAILYGACLTNANLHEAVLRDTDLRQVYFHGANLYKANLCGANLDNAIFSCTNLYGANLLDAKNIPFVPMACPEEGNFVGFKKACADTIVKLEIPADAKRSSATTRKCRCSKAKVLSIQTLDGKETNTKTVHSIFDYEFVYEVGKTVEVKDFDENRWNECSTGIHFFINRQEAVDY